MKKILISSVLILSLVGISDASSAAVTKPKKPSVTAGGTEGTAAHEQGEGAATEGTEGGAKAKKIPAKKMAKKVAKKAAKK